MTAGVFPPDVIAAARVSCAAWDVPTSVCLAQWALESGWGRAMPAGSNNPFGIKAVGNEPFVTAMTHEVFGGRDVRMPQRFRRFATIDEAFDCHGRLLATGHAYAAARTVGHDPKAFAAALQGRYATDPHYTSALIGLMDRYDLYRFDRFPDEAGRTTEWLQAALNRLGARPPLAIDGDPGPRTRDAIRASQAAHGLFQDGIANAPTLAAITAALPMRAPHISTPRKDHTMLTNKWLQFSLSALMTVLAGSASLDWSTIVAPAHAAGIAAGIAAAKAVLNLFAPGPRVPIQPTGGTLVTHVAI